jgi:hypothetical protein
MTDHGSPPTGSWVVICGGPDREGNVRILQDYIIGVGGSRYLVFRSREAAEREARGMNRIRREWKSGDYYKACRLKSGWMDGLLWHTVG